MSKRKKLSPEFKRSAVEQARQPGVSCALVVRELGIGVNLLTRWKREADAEGRFSAVQRLLSSFISMLISFSLQKITPEQKFTGSFQ